MSMRAGCEEPNDQTPAISRRSLAVERTSSIHYQFWHIFTAG